MMNKYPNGLEPVHKHPQTDKQTGRQMDRWINELLEIDNAYPHFFGFYMRQRNKMTWVYSAASIYDSLIFLFL